MSKHCACFRKLGLLISLFVFLLNTNLSWGLGGYYVEMEDGYRIYAANGVGAGVSRGRERERIEVYSPLRHGIVAFAPFDDVIVLKLIPASYLEPGMTLSRDQKVPYTFAVLEKTTGHVEGPCALDELAPSLQDDLAGQGAWQTLSPPASMSKMWGVALYTTLALYVLPAIAVVVGFLIVGILFLVKHNKKKRSTEAAADTASSSANAGSAE